MDREPSGLGPLWPLALFRIAFGVMYLDMAWQKAPWIGYGWLRGWIDQEIAHPTFAWYVAFLRDVMLPHFTFFAMLTFLTETALGLALLLGVLTRLAGLGGFLWQVNIALGAYSVPGEWGWIWVLLILPQLSFALCGAGRALGLDRWLQPALRRRAEGGAGWARLLAWG